MKHTCVKNADPVIPLCIGVQAPPDIVDFVLAHERLQHARWQQTFQVFLFHIPTYAPYVGFQGIALVLQG